MYLGFFGLGGAFSDEEIAAPKNRRPELFPAIGVAADHGLMGIADSSLGLSPQYWGWLSFPGASDVCLWVAFCSTAAPAALNPALRLSVCLLLCPLATFV